MANLEGIGNKFIVIKKDDLEKYLHPNTRAEFDYALDKIERMRKNDGKKSNYYVVINVDEPYADKVIELMKEHGHWG